LNITETQITVPIGNIYTININYTVPALQVINNFTGFVTIGNSTAGQEKSTEVILYVAPYYVNITSLISITFSIKDLALNEATKTIVLLYSKQWFVLIFVILLNKFAYLINLISKTFIML
jgi:hypothetical protein